MSAKIYIVKDSEIRPSGIKIPESCGELDLDYWYYKQMKRSKIRKLISTTLADFVLFKKEDIDFLCYVYEQKNSARTLRNIVPYIQKIKNIDCDAFAIMWHKGDGDYYAPFNVVREPYQRVCNLNYFWMDWKIINEWLRDYYMYHAADYPFRRLYLQLIFKPEELEMH